VSAPTRNAADTATAVLPAAAPVDATADTVPQGLPLAAARAEVAAAAATTHGPAEPPAAPPVVLDTRTCAPGCTHCAAANRIRCVAELVDRDLDDAELADALSRLAEIAGKRNQLGARITDALLGIAPDNPGARALYRVIEEVRGQVERPRPTGPDRSAQRAAVDAIWDRLVHTDRWRARDAAIDVAALRISCVLDLQGRRV
jgi:hypothetical protein